MLSSSKSDEYDVLVVGASFAGLSFAGVAAALRLNVLVVERDAEIGGVVRTTGVLFSDVLDILDVPTRWPVTSWTGITERSMPTCAIFPKPGVWAITCASRTGCAGSWIA